MSIVDYNEETESSCGTVFQYLLEEELDKCTLSDLNFDEVESLIENHPSSKRIIFLIKFLTQFVHSLIMSKN